MSSLRKTCGVCISHRVFLAGVALTQWSSETTLIVSLTGTPITAAPYTGSFINTPIDERGGDKRTSTVMNRHNLTIRAKLFESVPNRFLSTGTPGL